MIRLALLLALFAAGAAAQNRDWSSLNDWRLVCDQAGVCQIRIDGAAQSRGDSHVFVYRIGQAEIIEARVPLGIDLRRGIALRVDGGVAYATELLTCKVTGCVGFTTLTTPILRALAEGSDLDIVYTDSDTGRERTVAYSLVGFVRSYNAFFERR